MNDAIIVFLKDNAPLLVAIGAIVGMIWPVVGLFFKLKRSRHEVDELHQRIEEKSNLLGKTEETARQSATELRQTAENYEKRILHKEELHQEIV